MLALCLLVVLVLFVGYEIVERTWLVGVQPHTLRTLRLLRGLSAAAIAAALVTVVFLRRTLRHSPVEALPDAAGSLSSGLQHVSLRTKVVVPMVALAVLPAMAIGVFTISQARESLRRSAVRRVEFDTAAKARALEQFLAAIQRDLFFLSRLETLHELAAASALRDPQSIARLHAEVADRLLVFSQGRPAYYQVRYLDGAGHEVVRLDIENGQPRVIPPEMLQDKSDRYYVKAAAALKPGQIYVSPMDLNVEHGEIEVPHRGVVRYATPLATEDGTARGLLVINVYAGYLLSLVKPLPPGAEAWLIDEDQTYLGYVGQAAEKRALFDIEKRRKLTADYSPAEIAAIVDGRDASDGREQGLSGQAPLPQTDRGPILSSAPVLFDGAAQNRRWILMIAHPRTPLEAPIRQQVVVLSIVLALGISVAGAIGLLVGHYLTRPVLSLRRATREIAAGDLSKRVAIHTGDEIEGLANDFNVMTERLREVQERLARWNSELEREVARQTDDLHRLQSGLARADKLASIGQMTAGVMHEVGNPLAAIKVKIQVAEEDGGLCQHCQVLVSEILSEVDRLTMFLRAFSRLARTPEPRMEQIAVDEVVQDAKTLVAPELRRRGVLLRIDSSGHAPNIRGDAEQLRQLLINLILNAMEASGPDSEVLVRVRGMSPSPEMNDAPGGAVIEIVDAGAGIPPEIIDKIWDPFFTTRADGTGLGLSICRKIVEDHGGTMRIKSTPGEGTVVSLVLAAHSAGEPASRRDSGRATSDTPAGHPR